MKVLKRVAIAMVIAVMLGGCGENRGEMKYDDPEQLDFQALKELLLKSAPDDSFLMEVVAKEKSRAFSKDEVLNFMRIRAQLNVETPIIFGVSLVDAFVPPESNRFEENPPLCDGICGDIYYAYFYGEFPNGIFDPKNMIEGVMVFRYIYDRSQKIWKFQSYRFIDFVKVTSAVSLRAINAVTGEPVEGAKAYGRFGKGWTSILAKTDSDGKAVIYGMLAGEVEVRVFGGSFEEVVMKVHTSEGVITDIGEVKLLPLSIPLSTIKGSLFFKDGTPVAPFFFGENEILPIVYLTNKGDNPTIIPPAIVSPDGSFEIEWVCGDYELRVRVQNLERIMSYGDQWVFSDFVDISVPCSFDSGSNVIELPPIYVDNIPPKILSIQPEKSYVSPEKKIKITADVKDEDGDGIQYLWSSSGGQLDITDSSTAFWTAPKTTGTYDIFLYVNDRNGGIARAKVSINVVNMREISWENEIPLTSPDNRWSVTSYLYGYGPSNNIHTDAFGVVHMVWSDYRDGNFEIYYKYVDNGTVSSDFRISDDADVSTAPSVAGDIYSVAHIVWTSLIDGTEPRAMYAQVEFGNVIFTTQLSNFRSYSPSVAVDDYGNAHIVWVDERDGNPEIYYTTVADGVIGRAQRVSFNPSVSDYPAVAVDHTGKVYIVWADGRDGNWELYGKTFDGNNWSQEVRITSAVASSVWPRIAVDSKNRIHLVWSDWRGDGDYPKVYYKSFDPSSMVWSEDIKLNEGNAGAWGASIAVDEKDNIHVVWADERFPTRELFYRNRSSEGIWGEEVQLTNWIGEAYAPSIAIVPGGIAVIFTDTRDGYPEVYAKLGKFLDAPEWKD